MSSKKFSSKEDAEFYISEVIRGLKDQPINAFDLAVNCKWEEKEIRASIERVFPEFIEIFFVNPKGKVQPAPDFLARLILDLAMEYDRNRKPIKIQASQLFELIEVIAAEARNRNINIQNN